MSYITVRDAAKKWNMSLQVVRRMCRQERIPGTYFKDGNWYIPAEADRPKRTAERITEELKAKDTMAWVQRMNNIQARAEEIILQELIYGEATA